MLQNVAWLAQSAYACKQSMARSWYLAETAIVHTLMLAGNLAALAKEYQAKGVAVVAISPNSVITHPQDGPEKMAEDAKKHEYTFPFLYDDTQAVSKAYMAACTPEFYVFDKDQCLTYHGQYDATRPKQDPPHIPTGEDTACWRVHKYLDVHPCTSTHAVCTHRLVAIANRPSRGMVAGACLLGCMCLGRVRMHMHMQHGRVLASC